jgi:hypothetical protein
MPKDNNHNLKSILILKVITIKEKFNIIFHPNYKPPKMGKFNKDNKKLLDRYKPYYLYSNIGVR